MNSSMMRWAILRSLREMLVICCCVVEFDDGFGEIEIDGAVFAAARIQKQSETFHGAEMVIEMSVARGHLRIAFEDLIDVGVGHALGGTDDAGNHPGIEHAPGSIEMHDGAQDEALFARIERAHAVGKRFGKHGNGAIDEVDGIAAQAGFAIERRFGMNVMSDVGDVDLQEPAAIVAALDVNGVVEIARGFAIDRDDGKFAKIFAAGAFGFGDGKGQALGFLQHFGGKSVRKMMLANDDFGVHAEIAGTAENFDDAAGRSGAAAGIAKEFDIDDSAVEFGNVRQTFAAAAAAFEPEQELFAKSRREFFAGR